SGWFISRPPHTACRSSRTPWAASATRFATVKRACSSLRTTPRNSLPRSRNSSANPTSGAASVTPAANGPCATTGKIPHDGCSSQCSKASEGRGAAQRRNAERRTFNAERRSAVPARGAYEAEVHRPSAFDVLRSEFKVRGAAPFVVVAKRAALTPCAWRRDRLGMLRSRTTVNVRYAETDMMGIVYHGAYLPWFEIG